MIERAEDGHEVPRTRERMARRRCTEALGFHFRHILESPPAFTHMLALLDPVCTPRFGFRVDEAVSRARDLDTFVAAAATLIE